MGDFYKTVDTDGCDGVREATSVSTGVAEAGDIVSLNAQGQLDETLFPPGLGDDLKLITVGEDVEAGDFVNIFDDAGVPSIRPADNSNGREAHGFVRDTVAAGGTTTVYFEGVNDALTALVPGQTYFLGTGGDVVVTPPDLTNAATPIGTIVQPLGTACATTEINAEIGQKTRKL